MVIHTPDTNRTIGSWELPTNLTTTPLVGDEARNKTPQGVDDHRDQGCMQVWVGYHHG